ncbi:MAG TPA: HEAT repeat domain-containing protein [Pyrinomonadaceae bacterium]|nr:HEAT repeat domain-containing protein [Pyrinomonadaceae bacterium]
MALLVVAAVVPQLVSHAQNSYTPNRTASISAQPYASGVIIAIAADGPLTRPQSWQDGEGYHLVLPNTSSTTSVKTVRGVKLRRIGHSLEVLLQTKAGSKVSVQAEGNQINLVVDRKLEERPLERDLLNQSRSSSEQQLFQNSAEPTQPGTASAPLELSSPVRDSPSISDVPSEESARTGDSAPSAPTKPGTIVPQHDGSAPPVSAQPQVIVQPQQESVVASIFSATSVCVVVALGLFGLLVSRKLRSRQAVAHTSHTVWREDADRREDETMDETNRQNDGDTPGTALARSNRAALANGSSRATTLRMPVAGPTSLYGAYRIDQEVGKLVLGQPHRMDVLASRAIDDRRAIETSLIKGVNASDMDDTARRRAREALEEYGFVARQCATLLLAADPFERTSAARSLGEIKSEAALPFLLESLYDSESTVRNQAVLSIGELKMPSAIGALLDIARTHPDVPSSLLSRTLSACSVEGLDFFDAVIPEPAQLGNGQDLSVVDQITHLEPASSVEELPEHGDDEQLSSALALSASSDVQERAEALKTLVQFRVQSSVQAITNVARHDPEPNLRASAVSTLGSINHESVFPAILIGMADESREVRAAAARTLNRLSFDRADAYVRVIETNDHETVCNVARACVQAGIVSQNIDRLARSDYRQAYETFSLICLLAKADLNQPILDAIAEHPNMDVRLKAVHLLASTGAPAIFEHLRQLAVRDGVGEEVKTALLEAMYKLDQETKQKEIESVEGAEAYSEPHFETVESHGDINEGDINDDQGFAFSFEDASEPELSAEFMPEVQQDSDELEM